MKYDVKYSKGYSIGIFCVNLFLISGTIFLACYFISTGMISSDILQNAKHSGWHYVVTLIFLAVVDIIGIFSFIVSLRFKITVEDNKITVRKISSSKEYNFADLDFAHQDYVSYKCSKVLTFTITFKTTEKFKSYQFNEKMLNWTLLADKLVELGKLKKENGKYKDRY